MAILMRAPDGTEQEVPDNQVEHFRTLGAEVVIEPDAESASRPPGLGQNIAETGLGFLPTAGAIPGALRGGALGARLGAPFFPPYGAAGGAILGAAAGGLTGGLGGEAIAQGVRPVAGLEPLDPEQSRANFILSGLVGALGGPLASTPARRPLFAGLGQLWKGVPVLGRAGKAIRAAGKAAQKTAKPPKPRATTPRAKPPAAVKPTPQSAPPGLTTPKPQSGVSRPVKSPGQRGATKRQLEARARDLEAARERSTTSSATGLRETIQRTGTHPIEASIRLEQEMARRGMSPAQRKAARQVLREMGVVP